jgi:hypothetical protein
LILALTERDRLNDQYFTQQLLPDYMEEYPQQTADWQVTYDARGHFTEPHTHHEIGLGTLEVDEYLKSKAPEIGPAVTLTGSQLYPTRGPLNRYSTILLIEKEGFTPLLEDTQIAERFDVGVMSTKGMSVTAARRMLDHLSASPHLKKVLVLHDFDVYGFSIFGTLGTDTRRYKFANEVPIIDLGLRLADVEELGLESEPYEVTDWDKRVETLRRHGATQEEIAFLENRRVELNALSAPAFVEFLEGKLAEHAQKVIPTDDVIQAHARRIWQQQQALEQCKEILEQIEAEASRAELPADLKNQVEAILALHPTLSWDQALAKVMADSRKKAS